MEHALICPQCKAPLTRHRFAKQAVCSYCGTTVHFDEDSVSAVVFHEAYYSWNSPTSYAFAETTSIDDRYWAVERCIANGDTSDIYTGRLARWPTELVLLKVMRDEKEETIFEKEWKTLVFLQQSEAKGAETFVRLIPQPVVHGTATNGAFAGRRVSVFRWASGFHHTFEEVRKVYPQGISARSSIWVWRRILEVLSFIHASGAVHGAVLPSHLLVQQNEHGVRLVGYGHAGRITEPLTPITEQYDAFYPQFAKSLPKLSPALDLVMSARCIIELLGGNPATAELPAAVPDKLADFIKKISFSGRDDFPGLDAWSIREQLGSISAAVFGPSNFNPIEMPQKSY